MSSSCARHSGLGTHTRKLLWQPGRHLALRRNEKERGSVGLPALLRESLLARARVLTTGRKPPACGLEKKKEHERAHLPEWVCRCTYVRVKPKGVVSVDCAMP